MKRDFVVFVCSSDSYSDIWDLFFDMFHRNWPDFEGTIYFQTQEKEYSRNDFHIVCTKVGREKNFGAALRAGLDKVTTDKILLFMIDYILMGPVDSSNLNNMFRYFCDNDLDALYLICQKLPMIGCKDKPCISKLQPSDHVFSYQVSFWKKNVLKEMALPHENPWTSEWYGNKRAIEAELDIRSINDEKYDIFKYNHAGCLHRGKWMPDAVQYLTKHNYSVDFSKRGYYQDEYKSLKVRTSLKLTFILHGLKGSYWHHIQR